MEVNNYCSPQFKYKTQINKFYQSIWRQHRTPLYFLDFLDFSPHTEQTKNLPEVPHYPGLQLSMCLVVSQYQCSPPAGPNQGWKQWRLVWVPWDISFGLGKGFSFMAPKHSLAFLGSSGRGTWVAWSFLCSGQMEDKWLWLVMWMFLNNLQSSSTLVSPCHPTGVVVTGASISLDISLGS